MVEHGSNSESEQTLDALQRVERSFRCKFAITAGTPDDVLSMALRKRQDVVVHMPHVPTLLAASSDMGPVKGSIAETFPESTIGSKPFVDCSRKLSDTDRLRPFLG